MAKKETKKLGFVRCNIHSFDDHTCVVFAKNCRHASDRALNYCRLRSSLIDPNRTIDPTDMAIGLAGGVQYAATGAPGGRGTGNINAALDAFFGPIDALYGTSPRDQIARVLYRETSSLRPINGKSTAADLNGFRQDVAQVILNRNANGVAIGRGTASAAAFSASIITAIVQNRVPSAVSAWESSVAAASAAVGNGAGGSSYYFNFRPGAEINNNPNKVFGPGRPIEVSPVFNSTSGDYAGDVRGYIYPRK